MKRHTSKRKSTQLPPEALDAVPRLALVFTDETIYCTRFSARGEPASTYPVAAAGVASAFEGLALDTGLLPPDVLFYQRTARGSRYGMWLPPTTHDLVFQQGRREIHVCAPMPGLVWVGQGIAYSIFAATERPTRKDATLYHTPLPNVYNDGEVCAGSVKFPKASAESLRQAATLFFESHFNSDLSTDKFRSQIDRPDDDEDDEYFDEENRQRRDGEVDPFEAAHGRTRRRETVSLFQFLRGLEHKHAFPVDELLPMMTMGQLLSGDKNEDS